MTATKLTGRKGNLTAAALLLLIGVIVFTDTAGLGGSAPSDPGAAGYPRLIAGVMMVLAVALTFQRGAGDPMPSRRDGMHVVGAVALLIAYSFGLELLGYITATTLFLVGTMLLMGIRRWVPLVVVPVAFSVVLFFLFYTIFGVSLPREFLEGLIS